MNRPSIVCVIALAAAAATLTSAAAPPRPAGLAAVAPAQPSAPSPRVTFGGTEYLLRSVEGRNSQFTPAGQEDLSAFTDMLSLVLYPAAHDQEALATITSRVGAIAQGAKATVLQTISVSASGNQPGEHYFAAMIPTAHGMDFAAVRFVLVDNQGAGVFYTHRAYGTSAAGATSAWAKQNAANIHQKLLQFDASSMVASVKNPVSSSLPAQSTGLPAGTVRKGTLTSALLMHDTMLGVAGKMGTLGCGKVDSVDPYVVTPFSGPSGVRQWREKWLVTGCGKQYPINIDFKEDGAGGADWMIRNE